MYGNTILQAAIGKGTDADAESLLDTYHLKDMAVESTETPLEEVIIIYKHCLLLLLHILQYRSYCKENMEYNQRLNISSLK